jgi:hypothetical protein
MEMMMEMKAERDGDVAVEMVWLEASMERLAAAAEMLEKAVERLDEQQKAAAVNAEAGVERIVATVGSPREAELERRLAAVETELAGLRTEAVVSATSSVTNGRKTLPVAMATMLAKQGVQVDSAEPAALDSALASLSVEQRIAVKSQLLRAGLVG